jgi:hypothetical protein
LLTGPWGSNQTVTVTLYRGDVYEGDYPEVEIRLRSTLAPHSCTGYEALWSLRTDSSCYLSIVKWNGAFGDFVHVASISGAEFAITNGTTLRASVIGSRISMFINDALVLEATDITYTDGNPGVGFDHNGPSWEDDTFGFASFTATDDQPPDLQPPIVTLIAPTDGTTVSNSVQIMADATDNVAVAGVQFQVDGANVGQEVLMGPYSTIWDTALSRNGVHTLQAIARDWVGNTATSTVEVTVANTFSDPPTDSLVAAYAFDEGSGTTTVDSSGNGNTGTLNGATWIFPGKHGGALSFSGADIVSVDESGSLDLTNGLTLEAWVFPTAVGPTWCTVVTKETATTLDYGLFCEPTGQPSVYLNTGDVWLQSVQAALPLPVNTWSYLAATYDQQMIRLYLNGSEITNAPCTSSIIPSTEGLHMGGNTIWGEYFTGLIDEVRIHSRALRSDEIFTDMHSPVAGFPAITLQVPTQTADDISQNGFVFYLNATAPTAGTIEYTTNFLSWQVLQNFQYTTGSLQIVDPAPGGRFYRARQQ